MSEPRRFLEGGGGELEHDLLASAAEDAGSEAAHQRVLDLVGAGVSIHAASSGVGALFAGGAKKLAGPVLFAKWAAIGAVAGAAASGTAYMAFSPGHAVLQHDVSAPRATAVVTNGTKVATLTTAEEATAAPDVTSVPTSLVPAAKQRPHATPPDTTAEPDHDAPSSVSAARPPAASLAEEVALVDGARAALARRDARAALEALSVHDRAFPDGALRLEATVLEVRALLALGRRADAERAAQRVLAAQPTGPYAAHVRELLEGRINP